jgi:enoyl-CoA hydratase
VSEALTVTDQDAVRLLTLNRPERRNALDHALLVALREAVLDGEEDPSIRAMVVTGAPPVFCAGLDLKATASPEWDPTAWPAAFRTVRDLATPTIAAVNGMASTAGLGIVLACDFAIASSAAAFVDMHARIGVMSGSGMSAELVERIGSARAKQMWLTAEAIDAHRALEWGMVNEVVEPDALLPLVMSRAAVIAGHDGAYMTALLTAHNRGRELPLAGHREEEAGAAARWNGRPRS